MPAPDVADLAAELPYGAQVWLRVESNAAWTSEAHLLAYVLDALNGANWQRAGGEGEQPKPTPRPDELRQQRERDRERSARMAAYEERRRRREAARLQQQHEMGGG